MFYSLHFRKRELLILKCFFYLFRLLLNKLKELVSPHTFCQTSKTLRTKRRAVAGEQDKKIKFLTRDIWVKRERYRRQLRHLKFAIKLHSGLTIFRRPCNWIFNCFQFLFYSDTYQSNSKFIKDRFHNFSVY